LSLEAAVEAVRSGAVIGLPTDTVYGIGADPLNQQAVTRLFELKGRPEYKPIGLLVASVAQASEIGEIEGDAVELARRHWPGALTLVVVPKVILADWVGDQQQETVGLRVPDHPLAIELLSQVGPLAVTSANRSGEPEAMSDVEARALFGDRIPIYLEGTSPGGEASTVVDASGARLAVLRQGPVKV
jgi:tRNA threonylcarbamoyl adenosine modification protein (Sua5/YciO/YrdC/YwlC family)